MEVELFYFDGCPGYEDVRPRLERLLAERGATGQLVLVPVTAIEDAEARRFLGSPSVRVAGRDVEPDADTRTDYGIKCRIYLSDAGTARSPSDAMITAALDGFR